MKKNALGLAFLVLAVLFLVQVTHIAKSLQNLDDMRDFMQAWDASITE